MKLFTPILLLAVCFLILFDSCNKKYSTPTGSGPVYFTGTTYDSLATYDSLGKPSNLSAKRDSITPALISYIFNLLPKNIDNFKAHPELFTSNSSADLHFTQKTAVSVTFVQETAIYLNTVGFYTYKTGNPPTKTSDIAKFTYIFPNCSEVNSGGELRPGDKVNIGTFESGTSLGFVLMENAFKPKTDTSGVHIYLKGNHFCSADILNPEYNPAIRRHIVLLSYNGISLISFEDTNRANPADDNDFDDVTIYATQTPAN